jgi:membrane associated rhomboid family serine protease
MIFPLRDVIPSRTTPWVTLSLIAVNVAVFLWSVTLGEDAYRELLLTYGLIPSQFSWLTLVTSMFLHGGLGHVASNLISLWIFGDNVEDRFGHGRFLVFYLLAGAAAAMAQIWADPGSEIPMVGASGAISGVMGAYLVMFPHSRILVFLFLFLFIDVVEIPALVYLGVWFLYQILSGMGGAVGGGEMIAFWAHIGGFAAGLITVFVFRKPEREQPDWWSGTTGNDR